MALTDMFQHLPPDMKYNPDASPPQYANGAGDVIEKGSAVRVQLIGLRSDVGNIYAIGKMSSAWFGLAHVGICCCLCIF